MSNTRSQGIRSLWSAIALSTRVYEVVNYRKDCNRPIGLQTITDKV